MLLFLVLFAGLQVVQPVNTNTDITNQQTQEMSAAQTQLNQLLMLAEQRQENQLLVALLITKSMSNSVEENFVDEMAQAFTTIIQQSAFCDCVDKELVVLVVALSMSQQSTATQVVGTSLTSLLEQTGCWTISDILQSAEYVIESLNGTQQFSVNLQTYGLDLCIQSGIATNDRSLKQINNRASAQVTVDTLEAPQMQPGEAQEILVGFIQNMLDQVLMSALEGFGTGPVAVGAEDVMSYAGSFAANAILSDTLDSRQSRDVLVTFCVMQQEDILTELITGALGENYNMLETLSIGVAELLDTYCRETVAYAIIAGTESAIEEGERCTNVVEELATVFDAASDAGNDYLTQQIADHDAVIECIGQGVSICSEIIQEECCGEGFDGECGCSQEIGDQLERQARYLEPTQSTECYNFLVSFPDSDLRIYTNSDKELCRC
eukprot:TRINITY_DN1025_c0_g1_i3.p1 TRINITY_DN1025_c0_g1~~TRINITY_DN1025_c0_g1_i3.p1  ORF type:complete len:476 (+),score=36.72 TRINITY_DN1025_c0_g1_i3:118-1428(+)